MRFTAFIAVFFALADVSAAQNTPLSEAERAYRNADYQRVLPLLERALKSTQEVSELVRIRELRATVHVLYDNSELATQEFRELLRLNPSYIPEPNTSPKVRAAYNRAKANPRDESRGATEPLSASESRTTSISTRPVWGRWWFWTALVAGAGAVGVGVWGIREANYPDRPRSDLGPYPIGP